MGRVATIVSALLLVSSAVILSRLCLGDLELAQLRPDLQYYVTLQMEGDLRNDPATIRAYLPIDRPVQTIRSEKLVSSGFSYTLVNEGDNRLSIWTAEGIQGHEVAVYDAIVDVHRTRFLLPEGTPIPPVHPAEVLPFLEPSPGIQSDAPEILELVAGLLPDEERRLDATLRSLFDFVHLEIGASDYENTLDALTTLKWRQSFCGGKSRLLAAMLRAAGIPARLVGGLILTSGSKRTTHAWVEAWVNGHWVPFDALNGHFAEHPANYLVLHTGDVAQFTRTKNINFQYAFNVKKWRAAPDQQLSEQGALWSAYALWESFQKAHISLNLLRIVLLLPVGVLVVVFFRNVVGLTTFGTFHPALMAVAFRDTGLFWGICLYVLVLSVGLGVRAALDRMQLLHTPRLALILLFVVAVMLGVTYGSVRAGVLGPAHISMFPIAILAITVESFATKVEQLGVREALTILLQSVVVIVSAYAAMSSFLLQTVIFGFPETLLAVGAAYLALGRYVGLRLAEYGRFRWLWVG